MLQKITNPAYKSAISAEQVDVVQYHEGLFLQDSLRSEVKVSERVTRKLLRAFSQVLKMEATE